MSAVVADTHTIIWYLQSSEKLSHDAALSLLLIAQLIMVTQFIYQQFQL
jgi:PIN domain nuclease of toxin-antitoxin system